MKKEQTVSFYFGCIVLTYVLTLVCYLPFLFNFIWGNHDWQWVKEYTPLWSGVFEGRFSQFFLPTILFSGIILPILSLGIGLLFLTTSAFLVLKLWNLSERKIFYILISLNIIISPYTISWLYFPFILLSILSWIFVVICGFAIFENKKLSIYAKTTIATILFTLALGGYPPAINLMCVLFFTFALNDLCLNNISRLKLIRKYIPHGIAITLSVILLLFIQKYLKAYHIQFDTYNTAGIELSMLSQKIITCLKSAFSQFYTTVNFITKYYNTSLLIIVLSAFVLLFARLPKNIADITFFFLIVLGLLFTSEATLFAAKNEKYVNNEPRILFFSLPYIYAFSSVVILRIAPKYLKNITVLILTSLCFYNFNTTSFAAKIWTMGFKAETNQAERFIKRLEENPIFSPHTRRYSFIQGGTTNFRQRYYKPSPKEIIDSYSMTAPYIPWHLPSKAYQFYYPQKFITEDTDIFWINIPSEIAHNSDIRKYILETAEPWPHKNSIYVDRYTIILTLSPLGKDLGQAWMSRH